MFHILAQIYAANHATFPIQIYTNTVQICGNFWVIQYTLYSRHHQLIADFESAARNSVLQWSKIGNFIFLRYLFRSIAVANLKFISEKSYFFHTSATCSELPSNISTMVSNCSLVIISEWCAIFVGLKSPIKNRVNAWCVNERGSHLLFRADWMWFFSLVWLHFWLL